MLAVLALTLAAAASAPPAARCIARDEPIDDATLLDLEDAFDALRDAHADGDARAIRQAHARSRKLLERAVADFEDLALPGTPLEKALASDARKPYRGRPHERVLASALLAALDVERGRCDIALPTLRNAAFLDARATTTQPSDAVLVHALALRCATRLHEEKRADAGDVERIRADLRSALEVSGDSARFDDVVRFALAESSVLVLDGPGPVVVAEGAHGERARVAPAPSPAGARVVDAGRAPKSAVRIRLGPPSGGAGVPPVPAPSVDRASGIVVWSSTHQATTVNGRAYDAELARRAQTRERAVNDGNTMFDRARGSFGQARGSPKAFVTGSLLAAGGAASIALGKARDPRADTRCVAVFERAALFIE